MQRPSPEKRSSARRDLAQCGAMLRAGSRTFFTASLVLPKRIREPATALYAFCRLADDAIDIGGADGGTCALSALRDRLERIYQGHPLDIAADRAFAEVAHRFAIPQSLPRALLEGFEWDRQGRRYDDLAGVQAYAARVAGSVGAMMSLVMRVRDPHAVARACDLGVAMQLSNIARDVGEDAAAGRLYLPQQWMRDARLDPDAWLAKPEYNEGLARVVARLLEAADAAYDRAVSGIALLPRACRPGIRAARLLYAEIGHEVARRGYDCVTQRAVVPMRRKAALLTRAMLAPRRSAHASAWPPLDQTRFLVDAVAAAAHPPHADNAATAPWNIEGQVVWVIDLFDRLERRDRSNRLAATP
jgi:15-cis-phytoene synthase